ncbi:MAG: DNA primase [Candidatus Odinarchaeota archaeon]|nr:DNA primase [Candidatus Odinarchaeota archaeon]
MVTRDNSTTKYLIRARIEVDGVVDKPDVVGAIFGQTEGLLGRELDLRELQKTGRIGRIHVQVTSKSGRSTGIIVIPSSLGIVETAILAAVLETVDRVGPCSARVTIEKIEDMREAKRKKVIHRAVEILKQWTTEMIPESQEITEAVLKAFQTTQITKYGEEGLPAGPNIDKSDTIIIVEGRADVLNMLKHGFTNVIAVEGTSIPKTIIELSRNKTTIAFVDGDRGGELILRELLQVADIDYVARAPPGKEVEELTHKEIVKALQNKIPIEQLGSLKAITPSEELHMERGELQKIGSTITISKANNLELIPEELLDYAQTVRGTNEGVILDKNFKEIKKTATNSILETLKSIDEGYALVFDGVITQRLLDIAFGKKISYIIAARKGNFTKQPIDIKIYTFDELVS